MKERPILFSGPMVRAILDGKKHQTRRAIKPQPWTVPYQTAGGDADDGVFWRYGQEREDWPTPDLCPYGKPGDRLWVRETWCPGRGLAAVASPRLLAEAGAALAPGIIYRADGATLPPGCAWRPSIHMRRAFSRLTLEVVSVRVERLNDISEADARAEGLSRNSKDGGQTWKWGLPDRDGLPGTDDDGQPWSEWSTDARKPFAALWDRINGDRAPWESNPWVWVISFKRLP